VSNDQPSTPIVLTFLVSGVISLLLGLTAGLLRLPINMPGLDLLGTLHGPLMACGFLGTVIALERAAALNRPWAWLAPAGSGLGTFAMLFGLGLFAAGPELPLRMGGALFLLGGVFYVAIFGLIYSRQRTLFNAVMALGAVAYAVAAVLLLTGTPVSGLIRFWAGFLVLTIVGERLELNRLLAPKVFDRILLVVSLALLVAAMITGLFSGVVAGRIWGVGLILTAIWLIWRDIARRTVRLPGLTRYIAVCLLTGYGWLIVSGVLNLLYTGQVAGPLYDVIWHSLFLGFVMAMIFGHAPIIVPALTGRNVAYGSRFYIPLVLLHLSLIARILGNLTAVTGLRHGGGTISVVAILLFMVLLVRSLRR